MSAILGPEYEGLAVPGPQMRGTGGTRVQVGIGTPSSREMQTASLQRPFVGWVT